MYKATRGLVLRTVNYRESDKILTVLTEDGGKITLSARGARKKNSKISAAAQLFAFSEMIIHEHKGRFYLNEGRTLEMFSGLRQDIVTLSMASYFAEVIEAVSDEDVFNPGILSLGLSALYRLSKRDRDERLIKSAFELRLMCLSGYEPELAACMLCGGEPDTPLLDMTGGYIFCKNCKPYGDGNFAPLCTGSLAAMRHVAGCPDERVFSFSVGEETLARLAYATEGYVQNQLVRSFKSLDFLKGIQ